MTDRPPEYLPPVIPPTSPIPMSVVMYEGMRMAPSLVCLIIVGTLIHNHSIPPEMGLMGLLAILAGQLYPKQQNSGAQK